MASPYAQLLNRLYAARRFGVVLGLERMRALLDKLDAPDRKLGTVVHVAGTNGKGSTVAMIAALAASGGKKVAAYTSPHLSSLRERIAIGGQPISEAALVAAAEKVCAAGGDELTFFEQITAMAFVAIAETAVDITVLEVGLGGRLDATNVVAAPIAVITGIALDHEAILGPTIAAIAEEKAGIFKPGQRVVLSRSGDPAATPVLLAAAKRAGVETVTRLDWDAIDRVPPLALSGTHQRRNAAAALAVLDHLEALGAVTVDATTRAHVLATVGHPGRFEWIEGEPDIVVDGAHNPDGANALDALLREHASRTIVLVAAASADKDLRALVGPLAAQAAHVIATRYQQDRSAEPEVLAEAIREIHPNKPVETAPNLRSALARARTLGDLIVVAGSLFIVGEARVLLLRAPADPIAVSDPSARPSAG
ncbi:MAG: bifunctional folylpolyglutamate synthase/dihydrofolate synthase [Deltaproteobacteria bacterium]|nr:bifunctional folylpolyglutamate synthase/dihydrofolate synthase [Deltaproteobacteria bacterium]